MCARARKSGAANSTSSNTSCADSLLTFWKSRILVELFHQFAVFMKLTNPQGSLTDLQCSCLFSPALLPKSSLDSFCPHGNIEMQKLNLRCNHTSSFMRDCKYQRPIQNCSCMVTSNGRHRNVLTKSHQEAQEKTTTQHVVRQFIVKCLNKCCEITLSRLRWQCARDY